MLMGGLYGWVVAYGLDDCIDGVMTWATTWAGRLDL